MIGADATLDPVSALIVNGGVIGLFFALALLGQIALKPELNRRDDQEKRQQALIDTLLAVYHHEVLPTLGDYEKRLAPLLGRVERHLDELEWLIRQQEGGTVAPQTGDPRRRRPQNSPRGRLGESPGSGDRPPPAG